MLLSPSNTEEPEFIPGRLSTKYLLIRYWRDTLRTLDIFWEKWKYEYLTSLRERTQREHRSPRSTERRTPHEEEIVLVDEPETPREITNGETKDKEEEMNLDKEESRSQSPMEKESIKEDKQEEPIARRTRGATKRLNPPSVINCI
ncbi:unnamed protein product [Onchocerca ochengi]|uniref:DUF5641 domain-containing protein n=1 Tax=Onchocerca ochengi TaxID=42157 RepID=A0A182EXQ1_ONCOC|nr:unnamed protein product [Onchocerca ochengi]